MCVCVHVCVCVRCYNRVCPFQRDDELITIEMRNFFSLFCLDLEAQLVHVNLAQLAEVFEYLVSAQLKGQSEVCPGQVEGDCLKL